MKHEHDEQQRPREHTSTFASQSTLEHRQRILEPEQEGAPSESLRDALPCISGREHGAPDSDGSLVVHLGSDTVWIHVCASFCDDRNKLPS